MTNIKNTNGRGGILYLSGTTPYNLDATIANTEISNVECLQGGLIDSMP